MSFGSARSAPTDTVADQYSQALPSSAVDFRSNSDYTDKSVPDIEHESVSFVSLPPERRSRFRLRGSTSTGVGGFEPPIS